MICKCCREHIQSEGLADISGVLGLCGFTDAQPDGILAGRGQGDA